MSSDVHTELDAELEQATFARADAAIQGQWGNVLRAREPDSRLDAGADGVRAEGDAMSRWIAVALLVFSGCMCTDGDRTREALTKAGFTDISPGGYSWFGCGEDYVFHTEFTATNPVKQRVSGVVCCGWLKGCSVKF